MNRVLLSAFICLFSAPALFATANWGIDRIDQRDLPLDCLFCPHATGSGVHVYVFGTGIRHSHGEFGAGRANHLFDYEPPSLNLPQGNDTHGQGTHMASLVGGLSYGVARDVRLWSVRVEATPGTATATHVNAGIAAVAAHASLLPPGESAIALFPRDYPGALLGPLVPTVPVYVGAGDTNVDACIPSPGPNWDWGFRVGATDVTDARSALSNWGSCVDLFAPGEAIMGAGKGSDADSNSDTGTHVAAALTAGAAALLPDPLSAQAIFLADGTHDKIADAKPGSPNVLLHVQNGTCAPSLKVQSYKLSGPGTGTDWKWEMRFPNAPSMNTPVQTVTGVTGPAVNVARAFSQSINAYFTSAGYNAPSDDGYIGCGTPLTGYDFSAQVIDCGASVPTMNVWTPCDSELWVTTGGSSVPNCQVTLNNTCTFNPNIWIESHSGPTSSWALDRIDQTSNVLDGQFSPYGDGSGVDVYIVGTGINYAHTEFAGHAFPLFDFQGGDGSDCQGSGTYTASLVGGGTYGVAPGVTLHSVRVLNCLGSGAPSNIVAGLDAISGHVQSKPPLDRPRSVVLLTLLPMGNAAIEAAIQSLIDDDITVVMPAGDNNSDAGSDVGSLFDAIVVGATDQADARAGFSNYGCSVDLFAPGEDIMGAGYTSPTATTVLSGTPGAAALAAGVAAVHLGSGAASDPETVQCLLVDDATQGVIVNAGASSPNRLLHIGTTAPGPSSCSPSSCGDCPSGAVYTYNLSGAGTNTPWSWEIRFPNSPWLNTPVVTVPGVTGTAVDVARAFALSINDHFRLAGKNAPSGDGYLGCMTPTPNSYDYAAQVLDCTAPDAMLTLETPCAAELWVTTTSSPTIPNCKVEFVNPCVFNPSLLQLPYPGEDCNGNGVDDFVDVTQGFSPDLNGDSIPDECQPSSCPGSIQSYGAGCAGSGGVVPTLAMTGCPTSGDSLTLSIQGGLGGSTAILFLGGGQGSLPLGGGCSLLTVPLYPVSIGPVPLAGTGAGNGTLSLPFTVPTVPPSTIVTLQALIPDAGGAIGFSATNGVQLIFG